MRASSFLGTALVATSTALVVPQADVSLTKRQDYFDDADRYCHSWDMSDPESAKKLWDELGVGYHLDYFVRSKSESIASPIILSASYLTNDLNRSLRLLQLGQGAGKVHLRRQGELD
jgi:hypothetical protein